MRRGMTEQQAGREVQEVPVKSMMQVISQGVGELVEANKAKSAVGMLKELIQTAEPDPLAGLKHLKEIGLDFGTVTGIHKEAAQVYREMAQEEREQKREMASQAEKAKEQVYAMQLDMLKMQLENYIKLQQQVLEKIDKALGDGRKEPDPVTKTIQDTGTRLVEQIVQKALLGQDQRDPMDEITKYLTFSDKLAEYFRARLGGGDDVKRQALVGDIKLDVLKLILEDEREREHLKEQREIEKQRLSMLQAAAQALKENAGDFLRALIEAAQALKAAPPPPPQPQPAPTQPQPAPQPAPQRERVTSVAI